MPSRASAPRRSRPGSAARARAAPSRAAEPGQSVSDSAPLPHVLIFQQPRRFSACDHRPGRESRSWGCYDNRRTLPQGERDAHPRAVGLPDEMLDEFVHCTPPCANYAPGGEYKSNRRAEARQSGGFGALGTYKEARISALAPDARANSRSVSRIANRSSNASSDLKISRRRNIELGCVLLRIPRERLSTAKSSSE